MDRAVAEVKNLKPYWSGTLKTVKTGSSIEKRGGSQSAGSVIFDSDHPACGPF
jgi:hypothetical protein